MVENNIVPAGREDQIYNGIEAPNKSCAQAKSGKYSFTALGGISDPMDIPLMKPLFQATQACFNGVFTAAGQVTTIVQQIGVR